MAAITIHYPLILEAKKIKFITVSTFSPLICPELMGPDAMILAFLILSFKPGFSLLFHPHFMKYNKHLSFYLLINHLIFPQNLIQSFPP